MTPEQFCYWLQGYIEISGKRPTPDEWKMVEQHLKTVFKKVTPPKLRKKTEEEKFCFPVQDNAEMQRESNKRRNSIEELLKNRRPNRLVFGDKNIC